MAFGKFQVLNAEDQTYRTADPVSDTTILSPSATDTLEQGEWLQPTAADGMIYERHAAAAHGPAVAYPVAMKDGSTDGQALGKTELYKNWDVAITTTYNGAAGTYAPGQALKVNQVAIGGVNYSMLVEAAVSGDHVVAEVLETPSTVASCEDMRIRQVRYDLA